MDDEKDETTEEETEETTETADESEEEQPEATAAPQPTVGDDMARVLAGIEAIQKALSALIGANSNPVNTEPAPSDSVPAEELDAIVEADDDEHFEFD